MIYLDSCYVAKLYLPESDAAAVRAAVRVSGRVVCAIHGQTEVQAVFHRKLRENAISPGEFGLLMDQFALEMPTTMYHWVFPTQSVLDCAHSRIRSLPASMYLRAADAWHLATARESGFTSIYSSDRHLLASASHFGLAGVQL